MVKIKEIILNVIELYKSMPCLWDKHNVNYKSKDSRREGNRILVEAYKECDENATIKTVTKKIHNLRTNYFKELAKVRKAESMGDTYVPTLWYFDALSFLSDINGDDDGGDSHHEEMETIKLEDNLWTSSDEENDNGVLSEAPSTPPAKRKKFTIQSQPSKPGFIQMPERLIDIPKRVKMKEEDCDILGRSIGIQLRDINGKQLAITQKLISDAIYYAKMNMLSENAFIALVQKHENHSEMPTTAYDT